MKSPSTTAVKAIGILIFLGGIGLLALVFVWAARYLHHPPTSTTARQLGAEAMSLAFRVLILLVLGFVASAIAGRGIQLFSASSSERSEADRTPPKEG
ncbi:MAG: hypothetical protein ACUVTZ_02215 [Armatimonadota bacterium]